MPFPPTGEGGERDFWPLAVPQYPDRLDAFRSPCIVGLALVGDDDGETAVEYITMTPNTRALRVTDRHFQTD